jgi:DNA-binding XRE family transcriptional regulator
MIQNDRQFRVSRQQLARLEKALAQAEGQTPGPEVPLVVRQGQLNGIRFQIEDLQHEIEDYKRLQQSGPPGGATRIRSLADVPEALVRARIAQNLTQRELAERMGVRPQQVQQDEAAGYSRATLERLCRVAEALGVTVEGETHLRELSQSS